MPRRGAGEPAPAARQSRARDEIGLWAAPPHGSAARRAMWALRAAVRRGLRLSRVGRGLPAPRAAAPSCPARALAAVGRRGPGNLEGPWGGGPGLRADGGRSRAEDDEEEPEDADENAEEELLQGEPLLPAGTQRVCLVHPDVKWGPGKPQMTRAEWQVAEATALVHTLDGWSVVQTMVVSTKSPDRKLVFGKGNFQHLTEKIRGSPDITCVFLNVERMAAPTKKELEAAWGVEVFDRFTVVLHIFRCNARTNEARLQVALAEIPLHRSNLKRDVAHLHRGAGSRYIMGSGNSAASQGVPGMRSSVRGSHPQPWKMPTGWGPAGGSSPGGM